MLIRITAADGARGAVTLDEPDVFSAFSVRIDGEAAHPSVASALRSIGRVGDEGGHVFVPPDVIRGLAGERASDPEWTLKLEQMCAYAVMRGWCTDDGAIRAHIE